MKEVLERFLGMTPYQVLTTFGRLPRAERYEDFVYVPGTRADRALLVAHADTVSNDPVRHVEWRGNLAMLPRGTKKGCLGADDRAGIAMLWLLRRSGHSLLITDHEEIGCIGAQVAADVLKDELGRHQFAVQIDRRFDGEMVFYDCSTEAFEEYMVRQTGFRIESGSFSDISVVCPSVGICGVNLAAGYWNEHSPDEMLSYDAWLRTFNVVRRLLTHRGTLPKFALPIVEDPFGYHAEWGGVTGRWGGADWGEPDYTPRQNVVTYREDARGELVPVSLPAPAAPKPPTFQHSLDQVCFAFAQDYADDHTEFPGGEAWLYADRDLLQAMIDWMAEYAPDRAGTLKPGEWTVLQESTAFLVLARDGRPVEVSYYADPTFAEHEFTMLTDSQGAAPLDASPLGERLALPATT